MPLTTTGAGRVLNLESPPDGPSIVSAITNEPGTQITFTFSEAVTLDVNLPILLDLGVYNALSYVSGDGTTSLVYSAASTIYDTDTLKLVAERCWKTVADNTPIPTTVTVQEWDTPGAYTYVVPTGGTTAWYQAWGAGADGGAGTTTNGNGGPGGGGGAFCAGVGLYVVGTSLSIGLYASASSIHGELDVGIAAGAGSGASGGVTYGLGSINYRGGSGAFPYQGGFPVGGGGGGGGAPEGPGSAGIGNSVSGPGGGAGVGYPSGSGGSGGAIFGQVGQMGIAPGGGGGGGGAGAVGGRGAPGLVRVLRNPMAVTNNSTVPSPVIYSGGTVDPDLSSGWYINGGTATLAPGPSNHQVVVNGDLAAVTSMSIGNSASSACNGSLGAGSAFTGMGLFIMQGQPIVAITAVPPNLTDLIINDYYVQITDIPPLPNSLTSLVLRGTAMNTVPALPSSVTYSEVTASSFTTLSVLPVGLHQLRAGSNPLPQSEVDSALSQLVANGGINGTCFLDNTTAPSAAGLADKATLISRGWTVTTD